MSKSDSLQDIRDSMTDEDGYITGLFKDLEIPFVNILRDFTVLFHDNMVAFHNEEYLLGTLSERAMNVFVEYKMFNIIESLKYLNKIYKSFLVKNNELKKDDIKKIEYHISKINKVYGELLIFNEDLKAPLKLEKFYDYFIEELDDKSQYYLFLVTVLNAYLEVADTIVDFITIYYYFSQDFITEQSVFYNNDFAKAFDDYFNQPVSLAHRNDFFKFTDYTLGNITLQKSKFVNYKSLKTNENVIAELIAFEDYGSLLQHDYIKALQKGHTLRVCQNCERIFLQTTKYHTAYCDRIYKNTNKTCRKIGPKLYHKEKVDKSPIHSLALKCYNKVSQRYYRDTIDVDEYNNLMALVNKYKDDALAGKLAVADYQKLLEDI